MKTNLLSMDLALMTLWSILVLCSLTMNDGLLFGWPIQVHLTITGALIAFKMIFAKTKKSVLL